MSAFFVSKDDTDLLVSAIRQFQAPVRVGDQSVTPDAAEPRLGQMLWSENVKSLRARYPESNPEYEAERRDHDRDVAGYGFREYPGVKPAAIAAIADCYEHQTCEHGSWAQSDAYIAIASLRARLVRLLLRLRRRPLGDHRA
jgi:hypothetical protein